MGIPIFSDLINNLVGQAPAVPLAPPAPVIDPYATASNNGDVPDIPYAPDRDYASGPPALVPNRPVRMMQDTWVQQHLRRNLRQSLHGLESDQAAINIVNYEQSRRSADDQMRGNSLAPLLGFGKRGNV